MEHTNITREEKIQIAILVAIFILIAALIVAIIVLVKNIDLIKQDPVNYALDNTELQSCTCYTSQGIEVFYDSKDKGVFSGINFSNITFES